MALAHFTELSTARLRLRRVRVEDLPALALVNGDAETTRFLPYDTWRDATLAQAWFERMQQMQADGSALQLVVVRRHGDQPIGTALLFRYLVPHQRAELGYVLGRRHWGHGLMSEALHALLEHAFAQLQLRRVEAEVDPNNAASVAVLERLGFRCEGRARQRWVRQGRPHDVLLYGLLAGELAAPGVDGRHE